MQLQNQRKSSTIKEVKLVGKATNGIIREIKIKSET